TLFRAAEAEDIAAEFYAEREFVEDKLDIEAARKSRRDLFQNIVREALGAERFVIDAGRAVERCMADRVVDDAFRFKPGIAELLQRFGHRAVDDLEIAAARQLLEFDEGEIRLDPGGVAIHDEADRAGRGDDRDLRVAIAVLLAQLERRIPGALRRIGKLRLRAVDDIERDGKHV